MFRWFKERRRRRLLAEAFPAEWAEHLRHNVPYADHLAPEQLARLKDNLRIFVAEKEWVGCGGLTVTDEMRVTIAALACLLVLEIKPTYYYERVKSVLVYPGAYRGTQTRQSSLGPLFEAPALLGEAWHRSPIVLSWQAVLDGVRDPHDGNNVVFHEFAHHLDGIDGDVDGTPPLESREQYRTWDEVFTAEYQRHVAAARQGTPTLMSYYGATNEAEFFAVATECFFECGRQMRDEHPELYAILRGFYRQETAAWQPAPHDDRQRRRASPRSRPTANPVERPSEDNPHSVANERAIRALLEKIRLQPGSASAYFSLGILYLNARDYRPAAEAFSTAVRLSPGDAELLRHRGQALLGLREAAAAKADFDAAIALDPTDAEAYRARAEANVQLGDYEPALADCRAALAAHPRDSVALHLKGLAQAGLKDYKAAAASLTAAINADPTQAELYADRSRIFDLLGQHERAERDRIEAIRRDPELHAALRR